MPRRCALIHDTETIAFRADPFAKGWLERTARRLGVPKSDILKVALVRIERTTRNQGLTWLRKEINTSRMEVAGKAEAIGVFDTDIAL